MNPVNNKRSQPPARLVEKRLRITPATAARLAAYRRQRDDKPEADALRDVIFAGLAALNIPPSPLSQAA